MAKLKYKLNDKVKELPRSISMADLLKILAKNGISRDSFYRDRNISINDKNSIPSDRLDVYAIVFGCTTDELKNYSPKGKSILEVIAAKSKLKTGLN